jgi:hypothetical protein
MAREFALFVLESAYKTPVSPTSSTIWTQTGAGGTGTAVIAPAGSSTGFNAFYPRLDGSDSLTIRARPVMVTIPYGGGVNIPVATVSDKFVCKGRYSTKLWAGPFSQFLLQWASQPINSSNYVGGAGVTTGWAHSDAPGNLPSVSILHGIQRPQDGTYKCQHYTGVKVDSWTLTMSEDSQIGTFSMDLTCGTASGNPYDGSVDPVVSLSPGSAPVFGSGSTATTWGPPGTGNLPINPYLFVNCSQQAVTGSNAHGTAVLGSGATAGKVVSITETNLGSGYVLPPTVTFSDGGGYGAAAIAILNGSGGVSSYQMTSGGTGYSGPPTVIVSPVPASGLYIGSQRTTFQEVTMTSTNSLISRFWANRFVQFLELCGRNTNLTVRNFYQPTSSSPDDRYLLESLAQQTVNFGFNNGPNSILFTMNNANVINSVEDSLPLPDIYTQSLSVISQFDTNYAQTDSALPADMQMTFS